MASILEKIARFEGTWPYVAIFDEDSAFAVLKKIERKDTIKNNRKIKLDESDLERIARLFNRAWEQEQDSELVNTFGEPLQEGLGVFPQPYSKRIGSEGDYLDVMTQEVGKNTRVYRANIRDIRKAVLTDTKKYYRRICIVIQKNTKLNGTKYKERYVLPGVQIAKPDEAVPEPFFNLMESFDYTKAETTKIYNHLMNTNVPTPSKERARVIQWLTKPVNTFSIFSKSRHYSNKR